MICRRIHDESNSIRSLAYLQSELKGELAVLQQPSREYFIFCRIFFALRLHTLTNPLNWRTDATRKRNEAYLSSTFKFKLFSTALPLSKCHPIICCIRNDRDLVHSPVMLVGPLQLVHGATRFSFIHFYLAHVQIHFSSQSIIFSSISLCGLLGSWKSGRRRGWKRIEMDFRSEGRRLIRHPMIRCAERSIIPGFYISQPGLIVHLDFAFSSLIASSLILRN